MDWHEYINLPRLDIECHEWTMQGQVLKMLEELGEVSQALNKDHDLNKTAAETFDLIMTGITMLYMLEAKGVDVQQQFNGFTKKLQLRGYLPNDETMKVMPVIRDVVQVYEREG
ncbi:MAG TPA: hypothetical protein DDZ44_04900 [Syntrophomonas wolfei]|jgi:NTP pyrophosphatase (non-canonical NTP hydrolase)|uniref:NTP pyrophosphohydrolase MazG putative catalytic core domain-containing protein n=1 Tax=Syntrophomonas wolfei TaxID=863 RepID=A0A354YYE9_9FIRM|nr:hypothetical protein [Syntrophomonas wolfei]HBQ85356.1 hypothetical protein [Syntrophomonas sp.]